MALPDKTSGPTPFVSLSVLGTRTKPPILHRRPADLLVLLQQPIGVDSPGAARGRVPNGRAASAG
jgi:hypothetical protein